MVSVCVAVIVQRVGIETVKSVVLIQEKYFVNIVINEEIRL